MNEDTLGRLAADAQRPPTEYQRIMQLAKQGGFYETAAMAQEATDLHYNPGGLPLAARQAMLADGNKPPDDAHDEGAWDAWADACIAAAEPLCPGWDEDEVGQAVLATVAAMRESFLEIRWEHRRKSGRKWTEAHTLLLAYADAAGQTWAEMQAADRARWFADKTAACLTDFHPGSLSRRRRDQAYKDLLAHLRQQRRVELEGKLYKHANNNDANISLRATLAGLARLDKQLKAVDEAEG